MKIQDKVDLGKLHLTEEGNLHLRRIQHQWREVLKRRGTLAASVSP